MPDIWLDVDVAGVVPVNALPLIDDTDFKTRETTTTYNSSGLDLVWNFITSAGVATQTAITATSASVHDWAHLGDGIYTLELPTSGGDWNNTTEGYGWISGIATGVLPFRGPICGFRAAGLNYALTDDAYSATRGLSGTALPDAAADAAGGLVISDAGGLDADAQAASVTAIEVDTGTSGVPLTAAAIDAIFDEAMSGHTTLGTFGQLMAALAPITGAVNDAGATTTDFAVDGFTEATAKHFEGAQVVFTSGALLGQSNIISSYTSGQMNFTKPWTEAAANNDEFVVLPTTGFIEHMVMGVDIIEAYATALNSRAPYWALAKLINRVAVATGTLTVYEDDDTTALFTQTVTADASADPIVDANTN